jgi:hypothetical protein
MISRPILNVAARLENARLEALLSVRGGVGVMTLRRWILIFSVVATGLALSGCTKCGPIWDDWMRSPKSCKSDQF